MLFKLQSKHMRETNKITLKKTKQYMSFAEPLQMFYVFRTFKYCDPNNDFDSTQNWKKHVESICSSHLIGKSVKPPKLMHMTP